MDAIEKKEKKRYIERYGFVRGNGRERNQIKNYGSSFYDLFSFYNGKKTAPGKTPRFHLQSVPEPHRFDLWAPFENYFTDKTHLPDPITDILNLRDKTILDFGCGDGRFCHDATETYGASFAYGIDHASVELGLTDQYESANCKFISAGSQNIPLDNSSVDITTAFLVLEHIDGRHTDRMFEELHRVTKKGFIFSISHGGRSKKSMRKVGKRLQWWYEKIQPLTGDCFLYYPSGDNYKWGIADKDPNIGYSRLICTVKK